MKPEILLIILTLLFSCSKELQKIEISDKPVSKPQAITSFQPTKKEVKKKYLYEGLSYRDPFVPLSGEQIAKSHLDITKEAVSPPLGSLQLKGFIIDAKDKIALFSSPYGSYLLVNGKLYDNRNRKVKNFSGKISFDNKNRPQGVVLVTDEGEVREFKFDTKENQIRFDQEE
ncbi:MAG: hypothetical protein ACK4WJ_00955 [Endomicrobiia bacterium]